ncbi:MAG: hypothetical protein FJ295_07630 [Planctomycetes bacterium]|nr:hypothetical protein [Planctomycetota bacterium]
MDRPISRRLFSLGSVASTWLATPALPSLWAKGPAPADTLLLATGKDAPRIRDVKAQIEIHGDLKLNPDGKELRRVPLDVQSKVHYHERNSKSKSPRGLRYYLVGNSQLKVGRTDFEYHLRDNNHLVGIGSSEKDEDLYSVTGPLLRDELELLNGCINTLALPELLPNGEKRINESWKIPEQVLARLLQFDVVHQSDIQGTLKAIESEIGLLYFQGTLQASVGGVATEVDFKAKANFDRQRKFVRWIHLAYKENRSIGHAEPGYEATLQMKIVLTPQDNSPHLSDAALKQIAWDNEPITDLEFHPTKAPFRMQIGRHWRVVTDDPQSTIVRLVDRGDLIAQGDISIVPDAPAGKMLPLEEFQQEVENALGDNFEQFAEASQSTTATGLRMLRVVAVGVTNELSIQWNYYHLSSNQGQQAVMVFTCESELVDRVADQDRNIANSFDFHPRTAEPIAPETGSTAPAQAGFPRTPAAPSSASSKNRPVNVR